jgi:hypothetical protein
MGHETDGIDPLGFVISRNLKRRQLNESQLAFVALEIEKVEAERAKARQGTRTDIPELIPECLNAGDARAAAVTLTIGQGLLACP